MQTTTNIKLGIRVDYRGAFGRGPIQSARVIGHGEKNGKPLVDLDDGHWAYLNQVCKVYAPRFHNLTVTPYPVSPYLRDAYHKPIPDGEIKQPAQRRPVTRAFP